MAETTRTQQQGSATASPQAKASVWVDQPVPQQMTRTYYYADGTVMTRTGGTVAWRNNNEGNLRYTPFTQGQGAIGKDLKDFSIFPSVEVGLAARKALLFSSGSYVNLKLTEAIHRYAPPSENDTSAYQKKVLAAVGNQDKRMSEYSASEQSAILAAMRKMEGYRAGTETITRGNAQSAQPQATAAPAVQTPAPASQTASGKEAFLSAHPELKTNQDLINYFYRHANDDYNKASVLAGRQGFSMAALVADRKGNPRAALTSAPAQAAPAQAQSAPAVQTPAPAQAASGKEAFLSAHPELKTNQDLINYFYKHANDDYNKASVLAGRHGFSMSALVANRRGNPRAASQASAQQGPAPAPAPKKSESGSSAGSSGTPLYAQGDSRWGSRILGKVETIRSAGCAMCSTAMAISKISGRTVNPKELDEYLDNNSGYSGDWIVWAVAAGMVGLGAVRYGSMPQGTLDEQLSKGRPVVVSVKNEGHWVCVVSKDGDSYTAHDPAGGRIISGKWGGTAIKFGNYSLGKGMVTF